MRRGMASLVSLAGSADRFCISLLTSCELEAELNPGSLIASAMQEVRGHGYLLGLSSQCLWTRQGRCLRGRFILPSAP